MKPTFLATSTTTSDQAAKLGRLWVANWFQWKSIRWISFRWTQFDVLILSSWVHLPGVSLQRPADQYPRTATNRNFLFSLSFQIPNRQRKVLQHLLPVRQQPGDALQQVPAGGHADCDERREHGHVVRARGSIRQLSEWFKAFGRSDLGRQSNGLPTFPLIFLKVCFIVVFVAHTIISTLPLSRSISFACNLEFMI